MARKQEAPATTADVKDPASPAEDNGVQSEGGSVPPSADTAAMPTIGEGEPLVTDPGLSEGTVQKLPAGQVGSSVEPEAAAPNQAIDTDAPAANSGDSEGAGQVGSVAAEDGNDSDQLTTGEDPAASPNPAVLKIYPLRSYMDEGELRRRGGPAYSVPRRHAEELVQRKLASLDPLTE
ncbi:hypothetical protein [Pseudomonas sp. B5(2017)]|uniref:hypothetical protein n=1 Tax=Pseudomonas sp. B5(2017) TaxID=1981714 RepID=UPI00159413FF|nr:hypothetical protein [Pseudomonas sp. B5(2017)]